MAEDDKKFWMGIRPFDVMELAKVARGQKEIGYKPDAESVTKMLGVAIGYMTASRSQNFEDFTEMMMKTVVGVDLPEDFLSHAFLGAHFAVELGESKILSHKDIETFRQAYEEPYAPSTPRSPQDSIDKFLAGDRSIRDNIDKTLKKLDKKK